jgi:hypothetical protein
MRVLHSLSMSQGIALGFSIQTSAVYTDFSRPKLWA